jgi:hypothetical protein
MTQDDNTRDLVRRAGDSVPVGPAPVEDLLRKGRGARRRRTRTTIGAVAAAVVVVTSGAVAVGAQLSNNATNTPIVSTPTVESPNVTPPSGDRLVRFNGVGIEVPKTWGVSSNSCVRNVDIVISAIPGVDPCALRAQFPSQVWMGASPWPGVMALRQQELPSHGETRRLSSGVSVSLFGPAPCPGYCTNSSFFGAIISADSHVYIEVISSRALVHRILNSVTAVPGSPNDARRCAGLRTSLITPGRELTVVARRDPYHVVLHVGEELSLRASGPCASGVDIVPRQTGVMEIETAQKVVAMHAGNATLDIGIPNCPLNQDLACSEPNALMGRVSVEVLP